MNTEDLEQALSGPRDPPNGGRLCDTCDAFIWQGRGKQRLSPSALVPKDCAMCAALDCCMTRVEREYDVSRSVAWIDLSARATGAVEVNGVDFGNDFAARHTCADSCTTEFAAFPRPEVPTDNVYLGIPPGERLSWATKTFRECYNSPDHESCRVIGAVDPQAPTRLLDLGASCADSPDHTTVLSLIETNEQCPESCPRYACLSHCWGTSGRLKLRTTSANYEDMKTGIEFDALPKTFADAVLMTRALGLRYLWIDSLCIIQDHPHDWERECIKMGSVYHGAEVVIAAVAAKDCQAGCFQPWPPPITFSACSRDDSSMIHSFTLTFNNGHRLLHYTLREGNASSPAKYSVAWNYWPLLIRAWTYQERALARRILYCPKGEFVWRCSKGFASMCEFPITVPDISREAVHVQWKTLLDPYCGTLLTYYSDKLPAFAGLAQAKHELVKSAGGGRYLAGLWSNWLGYPGWHLLWRFVKSYDSILPAPRSASWRAPTWSWASIDGNAQLPFYVESPGGYQQVFEVLAADVTCKFANDYAQPLSGYLKLRGMTVPYRLDRNDPTKIQPLNACPPDFRPGIMFPDIQDFQTSTYSKGSASLPARLSGRAMPDCTDIVFLLFMMRSTEVDLVEALVLRCLDADLTADTISESLESQPDISHQRGMSSAYAAVVGRTTFERVGLISFEQWPALTLENANMRMSKFMTEVYIV